MISDYYANDRKTAATWLMMGGSSREYVAEPEFGVHFAQVPLKRSRSDLTLLSSVTSATFRMMISANYSNALKHDLMSVLAIVE